MYHRFLGTDIRDHSRLEKFKPELRGEESKRGPAMNSNSWVPPEWPKLERPTIASADKDVRQVKLSHFHCRWEYKLVEPLWKPI